MSANVKEWFVITDERKCGPKSKEDIKALFNNKLIDTNTLVQTPSSGEKYIPLSQTEIMDELKIRNKQSENLPKQKNSINNVYEFVDKTSPYVVAAIFIGSIFFVIFGIPHQILNMFE